MFESHTLRLLTNLYRKLEDNNAHGQNAFLLVSLFGNAKEKRTISKIIALHEKKGHLPFKYSKIRYRITQKYFEAYFSKYY